MQPGPSVTPSAPAVNLSVTKDPLQPRFLRVCERVQETADVVTLTLAVADDDPDPLPAFVPGQFNMLYAFGIGEVPISISGDATDTDRLAHTIRAVGAVSAALCALQPGDWVGVRGPYGNCWPLADLAGADVVIMASGIGLVPLRPVLYHLARQRAAYGRIALLYGARRPPDLLFRPLLDTWRADPELDLRVTLSRAGPEWTGDVGYVTALLPRVRFDPADTLALVCGPEPMIRSSALALADLGVPPERVAVSLERNMKCALGLCGRCQLGPHVICRDGPVFRYSEVAAWLGIREL